jgi:hypothetical protein
LEQNGDDLFFVRPPRFGKSLFVDMLSHYYDCGTSATEFDALFRGLDVHKQVTPFARSYHVLNLDLSIDVDGDVRAEFMRVVNQTLAAFRKKYNLTFPINEQSAFVGLKAAADAVASAGGRLYVLIDEYDRFANKLLVERREQYDAIVRGLVADPLVSRDAQVAQRPRGALVHHRHHAARAGRLVRLQHCD